MPLPPQIISLADLEVSVNSQPSESVEIRGNKLVWFGILPTTPTPMTVKYLAVGKGSFNCKAKQSVLDTFHIDLTAVGSDVRMLELSLQPTKYVPGNGKTIYTWITSICSWAGRSLWMYWELRRLIASANSRGWGSASVVIYGIILGLVAHAFGIRKFDRWMLFC